MKVYVVFQEVDTESWDDQDTKLIKIFACKDSADTFADEFNLDRENSGFIAWVEEWEVEN